MNNPSKKNIQQPLNNPSAINPNAISKENQISKESNTYSSTTYEYVTKKRDTLYEHSILHLESPKKENPNKRNDNDKCSNYQLLIKRIAKQLSQRIRLPTCKIIKVYQPYRTLIMRIAEGIKKSAKNFNYWNKWKKDKNKEENINIEKKKIGISLIKKEPNINSKIKFENNENIKTLSDINDSENNINFLDEFGDFLGKNNIEIIKESKLPSFKNEKNEYLLSNFQFWKKYINFVCIKFREEITFFTFINFIEQFHFWNKNPNDSMLFKNLITQKIGALFETNDVNYFLLKHKYISIDDLFARFKILDNNDNKTLEIKIDDDCECSSCRNRKEQINTPEFIKFPESNNNCRTKNSRITDYYGLSIKMKPIKNQTQKKETKLSEDKKILDYFSFKKVKKEKEDKKNKKVKEKQKSKSRSKSKKNKNSKKISNNNDNNNNNKKKSNANKKVQEILDLLNLDSEK